MKTKILYLILGIALISCSTKNDKKTIQNTEKKDTTIVQSTKSNNENEADKYKELEKKVNWFKIGIEKQHKLNDLPKSFLEFYPTFISDSIFQKKNVDFDKLIGENGDCEETTFLNEKNWEFIKWDFIKSFSEGSETQPIEDWNNTVYVGEEKIFFEYELKEVGVLYQLGFEKIDGKWNLTLFYANAC